MFIRSFVRKAARFTALSTVIVTFSSCCCCDPSAITEFAGDSFESQMEEQAKKFEEQAKKAQAQAEKMEAQAKAEAKVAEEKAKVAQEQAKVAKDHLQNVAKEAKKVVARDGKFQSDPIDKANLTSGKLKLDFAGSKVTGTFLGQYHVRPFSLKLDGKLDSTGSFAATGKADDSDVKIAGTHEGDSLSGSIKGLLRGKAIDAKFTAKRK